VSRVPEFIQNIWNKVKEYWAEIDKAQKVRLYITGGLLIAAIVVALFFALKVNYVVLLDTQGDDAALNEVIQALQQDSSVKYKVEGYKVLVDEKHKRDVQVRFWSNGIGGDDVKFSDTLEQLTLTTTESTKEEIFKNHYKNELQAKLKKLDFVKNANVMYTKPEKSIWQDPNSDEDKGSAYVHIDSNKTPDDSQVEGILKICSSALGIPVENITVVDSSGNVLNKNTGDFSLDKVTSQEAMRIEIANYYENEFYKLFSGQQPSGFDSVRISVNPTLYFDKYSEESKQLGVPDGLDGTGALTDKEQLKESMTGGSSGAEPGVGSNPGTVPSYQTGGDENSSYNKTELKEHYEWNITNTSLQKAIGQINKEDSTATLVIWYGKTATDNALFTAEYIQKLKELVMGVTGIPVSNINASVLENAPEVVPVKAVTDIIAEIMDTYGFFALVVLLMIVLGIMAMPRRKQQQEEGAVAEGVDLVIPQGDGEDMPEIEFEEQNEIKKQIEKFVTEKPESVAQLLRNWLQDDWE